MSVAGSGRVDHMVRQYGTDLYIFAASTRNATETGTFSAAFLEDGDIIQVYGEERTIEAENGYFVDNFDPLAVHIYVLDTNPPIGPVEAEYQIATGNDDMDCNQWNSTLDGTYVHTPYGSDGKRTFLRWQLDIPAGSTITDAFLIVKPNCNYSNAGSMRLQIVDSDNCPSFTTLPYAWSTGVQHVDWQLGPWLMNEWVDSPDMTALVQEFIDKPGYTAGNYLGLRLSWLSGTFRRVWSFEHSPDDAPILAVLYTPPSEPVDAVYQIAASEDDMDCNQWNSTLDNPYLHVPYNSDGRRTFLRWQLDIPAGAQITAASIALKSHDSYGSANTIRLQAIDSDNCPSFITLPYAWSVTGLSTDWVMTPWTINNWYESPDVTAIVQEFVNRPGYVPGNHIGLRVSWISGPFRRSRSFDSSPQESPTLSISYTP